jgi:hypothetical protein
VPRLAEREASFTFGAGREASFTFGAGRESSFTFAGRVAQQKTVTS